MLSEKFKGQNHWKNIGMCGNCMLCIALVFKTLPVNTNNSKFM